MVVCVDTASEDRANETAFEKRLLEINAGEYDTSVCVNEGCTRLDESEISVIEDINIELGGIDVVI
jgi:hypothetical protein